jgi:hypothetical protein
MKHDNKNQKIHNKWGKYHEEFKDIKKIGLKVTRLLTFIHNVTMMYIHKTTVALEKQLILQIVCVCL